VVTSATNRNFRPLGVPIFATMFRRGLIHLVVACALVAPSAAAAQEPVQVDPDSPAGVEYKLPLEQARRDAAPGADGGGVGPRSGGGSGGPAPLFGAGISAAGSQSDGSGGAGATGGDGNRADGEQSRDDGGGGAAGGGGSAAGPGAGESAPSAGTTADENGGGSTGLILGGIALAVVVVGGALGLALRRGLRTTPAS
jgi:hypothetical protein